jgi:hypothetical protein
MVLLQVLLTSGTHFICYKVVTGLFKVDYDASVVCALRGAAAVAAAGVSEDVDIFAAAAALAEDKALAAEALSVEYVPQVMIFASELLQRTQSSYGLEMANSCLAQPCSFAYTE